MRWPRIRTLPIITATVGVFYGLALIVLPVLPMFPGFRDPYDGYPQTPGEQKYVTMVNAVPYLPKPDPSLPDPAFGATIEIPIYRYDELVLLLNVSFLVEHLWQVMAIGLLFGFIGHRCDQPSHIQLLKTVFLL